MSDYRKVSSAVVFNDQGKILMLERSKSNDGKGWQFSQGGIEEGEDPLTAATRELWEETSIRSVKFVKDLGEPLRFLYSGAGVGKYAKIGAEVKFFLFFFYGKNSEINLNTDTPEFKDWEWVAVKDYPIEKMIEFKQEVYRKVLAKIEPEIEAYIKNNML